MKEPNLEKPATLDDLVINDLLRKAADMIADCQSADSRKRDIDGLSELFSLFTYADEYFKDHESYHGEVQSDLRVLLDAFSCIRRAIEIILSVNSEDA